MSSLLYSRTLLFIYSKHNSLHLLMLLLSSSFLSPPSPQQPLSLFCMSVVCFLFHECLFVLYFRFHTINDVCDIVFLFQLTSTYVIISLIIHIAANGIIYSFWPLIFFQYIIKLTSSLSVHLSVDIRLFPCTQCVNSAAMNVGCSIFFSFFSFFLSLFIFWPCTFFYLFFKFLKFIIFSLLYSKFFF